MEPKDMSQARRAIIQLRDENRRLEDLCKIDCAESEQEIEIRRDKVAPYFLYASWLDGGEQYGTWVPAKWFPEIEPGETRKAKIVLEVK